MSRATRIATALLLLALSPPARAELELELGGRLETNLRFRVAEVGLGSFYDRRALAAGVERNENILKLQLTAEAGRFRGIVETDVVWLGFSPRVDTLLELSDRALLEPVRIEAHSVAIEASDLFVDGLDLRLGQQIVAFGVGDQFNPTNSLNSDDLEDPLLFGAQQANLMARADYSFEDYFTITGVLVPVFRPAQLPVSAELAIAAIDRLPHRSEALRRRIHAEAGAARAAGYPTIVGSTTVVRPEPSFENLQFELRFATNVFDQDLALSFYQGFSDFPVPFENVTTQVEGRICDPAAPATCVDGTLSTEARLTFPKVRVVGLNLTGEVDALGWISEDVLPIGYRLEVGLYLPEERRMRMLQGPIRLFGIERPAGEYLYDPAAADGGAAPVVVPDTPFLKWTVGLDYTFAEWLYVNLQWVHGLVDEFGAGDFLSEGFAVRAGGINVPLEESLGCTLASPPGERCTTETLRRSLGDYLVVGLDFKFSKGDGLFRLFNIIDLTGLTVDRFDHATGQRVRIEHSPFSADGFSAVIYPELGYNFGNGLELSAGALVKLGAQATKFGDPAAGGTIVWTRGRFSF